MSLKSLLCLPLVGALVLFLTGSVQASSCPETHHPMTHTLTINNGQTVERQTFVRENRSWHTCRKCESYDIFIRDCPRSL